MSGWEPIETAPTVGTVAILYTPPKSGNDNFEGLDYRYELAVFRETELGQNWHEQGTNHLVQERGELPTHWMPFRAPPEPS